MNYKLDLGGWNSVFAVPSPVVDNYIKLASGNAVKVLLYFLRHSGDSITLSDISKKTGVSEPDVADALTFWSHTGLLHGDGGLLSPAEKPHQNLFDNTLNNTKLPLTNVTAFNLKKVELDLTRDPQFKPKEIAVTIMGSEKINFLFKECERLFGRPLKHNEQNMLMIITEDAGLAVECTLMLIEYCCSEGKATPAYIKKIALNWVEKEIDSVMKAEEEIRTMRAFSSIEGSIKRLFEINSAFSKMQKDYIVKWTGSLNMTIEMIDAAYQLTLNNTGKASFPYMDKILSGWRDKGYNKPSDLEKEKRPEKQESKISSFDIDELYQAELQKYN